MQTHSMDTQSHLPHNDLPIIDPSEDHFGIDPFAKSLAISIRKLHSPHGTAIGLNGPWGSGKSSAVNLVRHHLAEAVKENELVLIDFNCWWFRGEEALALAFFRELYAGMAPSLGDKAKKALPKLGARLLRASALIGKVAEAAGAVIGGGIAEKGMEWLAGLVEQGESVESLHRELSTALSEKKKRFLIIIDDIDRLSPEEALLIFRLVKSVGRLPNVMYLLVYDRQLAEKIVSERYPSEGPHYLEKIVQFGIELPEPSTLDMQQHLLSRINLICGEPEEEQSVRFMNIFYEGVAPEMRTPRDITRLTNSLTVTWPAVADEVDRADFVALEVFRLLHPQIYRAIQQNKDELCKSFPENRTREPLASYFDETLLSTTQEAERKRIRKALMRLFPVLEWAWLGQGYSKEFASAWEKARRVCTATHFDTYFRFSISDETLTRSELREIVRRAGDQAFVIEKFRHAATVRRRSGGTKAAVLLSELNTHADEVPNDQVLPLLSALFSIADELDSESDRARGFDFGNNDLRLHWLMRGLILDRLSLTERSALLLKASENATLGWLASLASSAWNHYHPDEGKPPEAPERCLTTEDDASRLRDYLRNRLAEAAKDGTLAAHPELAYLLYRWNDLADDAGATVKVWTTNLMKSDEGLRRLAIAFTSESWSQGMGGLGDLVAKRSIKAQINNLDELLSLADFRRRIEEVAAADIYPEVRTFLAAWQRQERIPN